MVSSTRQPSTRLRALNDAAQARVLRRAEQVADAEESARVERSLEKIHRQIRDGEVDLAAQTLAELHASLGRTKHKDVTATEEALAQALVELVREDLAAFRTTAARSHLEQARTLTPELSQLIELGAGVSELEIEEAQVQELRASIASGSPLEVEAVSRKLSNLGARRPEVRSQLEQMLIDSHAQTFDQILSSNSPAPATLAQSTAEVSALVPQAEHILRERFAPKLANVLRKLGPAKTLLAHDLYDASGFLKLHSEVIAAHKKLPAASRLRTEAYLNAGRLNAADRTVKLARIEAPRSGKVAKLRRSIDTRMAAAIEAYTQYRFQYAQRPDSGPR